MELEQYKQALKSLANKSRERKLKAAKDYAENVERITGMKIPKLKTRAELYDNLKP